MIERRRFLKWTTMLGVALCAAWVGWFLFDSLVTTSSGKTVILEASDGAIVKIESVKRNAVNFLAGSGGVIASAPATLPATGILFFVVTCFALVGAASLFRQRPADR